MKLRATCVTSEVVGNLVGAVCNWLEASINPSLNGLSFGGDIEQFTIVFVAVGDEVENARFVKEHEKTSRYKSIRSVDYGAIVRYISVAISIDPMLLDKDIQMIKPLFIKLIRERFLSPFITSQKNFDQNGFVKFMGSELTRVSTRL